MTEGQRYVDTGQLLSSVMIPPGTRIKQIMLKIAVTEN